MLPSRFEEQMKSILKSEYENFYNSYHGKRYYGLRLNRLKATERTIRALPFETIPIAWCETGFYYNHEDIRPAKDPYYYAGCYYIQEPSAMTPAVALCAKPGERIIDLCAAPGGKSTQIASDLQNKGLLVTNDISSSRVKNLDKNIQLSGIRNALILSESPSKLADKWPNYFDKVLVDAPCSGEGMFRKEPKLMKSWEEKGPDYFTPIQEEILEAADKLLVVGGELVYSTCTYNLDENEGMMNRFLTQHPNYELVDIGGRMKVADGFNIESGLFDLTKTKRVWPHLHKGEGHFIAKLRKISGEEGYTKELKPKITDKQREVVTSFTNSIGYKMDSLMMNRLNVVNDKVYILPEYRPDIKGLRVFKNGWYIGGLKNNRFKPSQAFASGLMSHEVDSVINYSRDDHNIIKYLKGETLIVEQENGWYLISVDHYSLGWAKVVNKRLKNKFEPSWRWL